MKSESGENPKLDPETSRCMIIGLETCLLQQLLKMRAQYFSHEIDDVNVYTFTAEDVTPDTCMLVNLYTEYRFPKLQQESLKCTTTFNRNE